MKRRLLHIGTLMAAMCCAVTASATVVLKAPLADLVRSSKHVVHATVVHVNDRVAKDNNGPFITHVQLNIIESLKGPSKEKSLQLVLPGGKAQDREMRIAGMPKFRPGEEVVLLLEETGNGALIPTGLHQGVFYVDRSQEPAIVVRDKQPVVLKTFLENLQTLVAKGGNR